jgi:hypothetical protein
MKRFLVFGRTVPLLAMVALCLAGANKKHPYSPHEKAFYADASLVEHVLPGLTITINSARIASDGTISVLYTLTDPSGLPLDAVGVTTPGTITLSDVAAVLANSQEQYLAHTTCAKSGPAVASTNQPGADSGEAIYLYEGFPLALGDHGIKADTMTLEIPVAKNLQIGEQTCESYSQR